MQLRSLKRQLSEWDVLIRLLPTNNKNPTASTKMGKRWDLAFLHRRHRELNTDIQLCLAPEKQEMHLCPNRNLRSTASPCPPLCSQMLGICGKAMKKSGTPLPPLLLQLLWKTAQQFLKTTENRIIVWSGNSSCGCTPKNWKRAWNRCL